MIPLADTEFRQFQQLVERILGIHLNANKKALVCGRLERRLRAHRLTTYSAYLKLLSQDANELQQAVDLITTHETYFFREPSHFQWLEHWLGQRSPDQCRIWSAACSSGEEAYSIAMVMAEVYGLNRPWQVFASDVSQSVLQTAEKALYPISRADKIAQALLKKYCLKGTQEMSGYFLIDPALRAHLSFDLLNLKTGLPDLGLFDAIFLRNVMIYFNDAMRRFVLQQISTYLKPDGYIFVGHSESLSSMNLPLVAVGSSIYRYA